MYGTWKARVKLTAGSLLILAVAACGPKTNAGAGGARTAVAGPDPISQELATTTASLAVDESSEAVQIAADAITPDDFRPGDDPVVEPAPDPGAPSGVIECHGHAEATGNLSVSYDIDVPHQTGTVTVVYEDWTVTRPNGATTTVNGTATAEVDLPTVHVILDLDVVRDGHAHSLDLDYTATADPATGHVTMTGTGQCHDENGETVEIDFEDVEMDPQRCRHALAGLMGMRPQHGAHGGGHHGGNADDDDGPRCRRPGARIRFLGACGGMAAFEPQGRPAAMVPLP